MAKGITQDQVSAAADALVTAGERPTVEKIRGTARHGLTQYRDPHVGHLARRACHATDPGARVA